MSFESKLTQGEFCIPECTVCKKTIWPPVDFCKFCFTPTSLKKGDFEGIVIEFSSTDGEYFCIVEFENEIRIMAKRSDAPEIGQKVRMTKCGISDGSYFFYIS